MPMGSCKESHPSMRDIDIGKNPAAVHQKGVKAPMSAIPDRQGPWKITTTPEVTETIGKYLDAQAIRTLSP